jgi:uncharacterized CHY-type Zn-finger protein
VRKEIIIPFSDLRTVSVECGDCHALITLDIEREHDVTQCAACNREYEPAVKNTLDRLHTLYLQMKDAKHKFSFRIPAGEHE